MYKLIYSGYHRSFNFVLLKQEINLFVTVCQETSPFAQILGITGGDGGVGGGFKGLGEIIYIMANPNTLVPHFKRVHKIKRMVLF